jgi:acetyl-CoA C-acetyltransferase
MLNKPIYIIDGSRTPFLKARGKPGPFTASDLAVACGRALLARQPFEPGEFDEVILGCAMPSPDEANIGRVSSLRLGCGKKVPAWTVMRNCASGMQALDSAFVNIISGRSSLVLAGGVDAMSRAPVLFNDQMVSWLGDWYAAKTLPQRLKLIAQFRLRFLVPVIGLLRGLTDPVVGLSMGQTAENLAYRFGISRKEMDAYATESHRRLAQAQDNGYLKEIEPLYTGDGKILANDDGIRRDSSVENLAKLKPFFDKKFGAVTAGNSSQVTDGAAWLILADEETVNKYNLKPLGRIIDSQWAGVDPAQMGLGPIHAMTPIMQRHGLKLSDLDAIEINEAFAAQVLGCIAAWQDADYCRKELGLEQPMGKIDLNKLNIDGGAISIGHPVGASGARLTLHLLHVLRRTGGKRGIASLCIGGGQGGAMLVEVL